MGISENAAYIKGLFDGYVIDTNTKEGKIISKMLDLLCDMSDKINALEADNRDLHEYVEELDHDLGEVEEEVTSCHAIHPLASTISKVYSAGQVMTT